jgi:hypothetical protein
VNSVHRRLFVLIAALALLAGGTVAAMAATGHAGSHNHAKHDGTHSSGLLAGAAAYIGISPQTLAADLRSGSSIGAVAVAAGKTEAGLVEALARSARARVEERLAGLIKQAGGPRAGRRHPHVARAAAAAYLGVSQPALAKQLRSGKTLGQLAGTTPGHSEAGLIDAIVSAKQRAHADSHHGSSRTGSNTPAARAARSRKQASRLVQRVHLAKGQG